MENKVKRAINADADQLIESFKSCKPFETWRIKVDGVFIMTRSGKTVWKRVNHAKNALRHHFETVKYQLERELGWKFVDPVWENEYQEFLKDRVEFVRVD